MFPPNTGEVPEALVLPCKFKFKTFISPRGGIWFYLNRVPRILLMIFITLLMSFSV